MAKSTTLMDKVQAGAKSTGESRPSVGQLASQQGLAMAPLTAYGTSLIGGNQQQAKMAGTPAQKASALQAPTKVAAPTGESQLEQAQTLQTAPTLSAEEEAKKEQAAKYAESLGTFGAKVSEWVEAAKKQFTAQTATAQIDVSDKLLTGLDAGKKTEATDILKQIAVENDPTKKFQLETRLNIILGRNVDTILKPEEKQELYQSVADSIRVATTAGQEAVAGADRKLTLADMTNLGTTQQELATLLGLDEKAVGDLSISQLQQKIAEVSQQQFGTAQQAQAGLASAALSSADRAALRQYLRGAEQAGLAGAEAAVASIASQIDRDQTITFAGKSYKVDELLGTPAVSDIIQQAITEMSGTTKTGPTLEALKTTEPALYKWLTDNMAGVKILVDQSTATSKSYGELQKANVASLGEIASTQPELAKEWGYDPKALRAEAIDPTKLPGAFQALAAMPKEEQKAAAGVLSQLNKAAGTEATKNLTKEQVDKLQLNSPSGPAAAYINASNDAKSFQNASYIEDVIKGVSTGDESLEQLNKELEGDALAVALGLPGSNARELDVNQDGRIDEKDMPGLKERYGTKLPSLVDVANGVKPASGLNQWSLNRPRVDSPNQSLFDTLSAVTADGKIDENEKNMIKQIPLSWNTLDFLIGQNWDKVKGGADIKTALNDNYRQSKENLAKSIASLNLPEVQMGPGTPTTPGGNAPARDVGSQIAAEAKSAGGQIAKGTKRLLKKGRL